MADDGAFAIAPLGVTWDPDLQIADTLYISRNTVKTHLRSIYHKLGASSSSQAVQRAVDLRLI